MAPKAKASGSAEKSKSAQGTEDPLQALVFADSFETRFAPFTNEKPRCLLPLANTPLIEYTLTFLAANGVEEVFLYCGAHASQIDDYLKHSKWTRESSPFTVKTIQSTSKSIGDAMRDLDKRAALNGDFVVLYSDVISNLPLGKALAEHKARRAKDKNAIMTIALQRSAINHRSKAQDLLSTFVIDPDKNRCLHYAQVPSNSSSATLELEPEIVQKHASVDIRTDLIDCGIDICTPDVLALWTDNFDYEAPRRGFLHSVLKDYELNGKTIHTHIFDDHYAARVRNLRAYDAVSKDVIYRWAYPLNPDSNFFVDEAYTVQRRNIYQEAPQRPPRSSRLGRGTIIGRGTKVGVRSTISRSVVGRNCKVGADCKIQDSYIWDNTTIKDGAIIDNSIIGNNSTIGERSNVSHGTLISFNVAVPAQTMFEGGKHVVRHDSGEGYKELEPVAVDDDEPGTDLPSSFYTLPHLRSSQDSISTLESENPDLDIEVESDTHHRSSFTSLASEDSHTPQASKGFFSEASGSIYDSLIRGHDVANIQLELSALRLSSNASEHEVRRAVVSGLLKYISEARKSGTSVKNSLMPNKTLVEKTIFDDNQSEPNDQVDFLLLTQNELSKHPDGDTLLALICNELYVMDSFEQDLFEAEAFQQWWADKRSVANEGLREVRLKTQRWMDALEEDEEEEEDEESDSE